MEVRVLGYNGPYPSAGGACSGYLLSHENDRVLIDCGPGVLARLMAKMDPARLNAVLLSHSHGDHCSDLLAMRYYLDIRRQQDVIAPLDIFAPEDPSSPVQTFLLESESFRLHFIKAGDMLPIGSMEIICTPARHPVPAVGFKTGTFGYTGDTTKMDGLAEHYRGMSVLLADGCFLKSQWKESHPHMAAYQAAELARDAGVQKLVVTHLRPDVDEATLLKEAAAIFSETKLVRHDMLIKIDSGR